MTQGECISRAAVGEVLQRAASESQGSRGQSKGLGADAANGRKTVEARGAGWPGHAAIQEDKPDSAPLKGDRPYQPGVYQEAEEIRGSMNLLRQTTQLW